MNSHSVTDEIAAALRDSMSASDRLASWTFRWSLSCGQLVCAQCQASQAANQFEASFVHRLGCRARRENRPWLELQTLLGSAALGLPPGR